MLDRMTAYNNIERVVDDGETSVMRHVVDVWARIRIQSERLRTRNEIVMIEYVAIAYVRTSDQWTAEWPYFKDFGTWRNESNKPCPI
jgi:hypothetical protein